jgi:glycosidase
MLLTLPGLPCVYTGDEVGEAFSPYYDPAPITWKENFPGLRDFHKKLIAMRKGLPSLHSRLWTVASLEPHTKVYGYLRYLEGHEQPVLVLLNFYGDEEEVVVSLPEEFQAKFRGSLDDLLNEGRLPGLGSAGLKVKMPGYGVRILAPQGRG